MGIISKMSVGGSNHLISSTAYGECTTAANQAAKVVTLSDFDTFTEGMEIRVKFTNSNTASSPTLDVNSKGAKNIYAYGTTAPGTTTETSWEAGAVVSFTYNTTNNASGCWVMNDYIKDTDTTYSNVTASSGSSTAGLCTGGEKYTWNNKQNAVTASQTDLTAGTSSLTTGNVYLVYE